MIYFISFILLNHFLLQDNLQLENLAHTHDILIIYRYSLSWCPFVFDDMKTPPHLQILQQPSPLLQILQQP